MATAAGSSRSWRWPGYGIAAAIGAGAVGTTGGPLRDVDVFWHVRLGGELLDGVSIYSAGKDWSYAPVPDHWVSTQWIVEILFSWLNTLAGFSGLVGYRTVTTAAAIAVLAVVVFRGNRVWAALVTYCLGVFSLLVFAQERPQQISFILLPVVGLWWLQAVRDHRVPRWWLLLVLSAVWANCHGLWIMLPVALGLALAGVVLDEGRRSPMVRPLLIGIAMTLIGGSLTPIGPLNLLTPIRFAGTTSQIVEWEPTSFISLSSAGLAVSLLLFVLCWARGRRRPDRSEILYVAAIGLLGAAAGRNVTPAVLMLAAVLAARLTLSFAGPRARAVPAGLAGIARPATVAICGVGVVLAGITVARSVPIPPDSRPVGLVERIAARTTETRVLNGYNVSGLVLWFSRPAVSSNIVRVGIDGRADRYGAAYIDEYLDMERGRPGWDATVDRLEPDVALLPETDALVPLLRSRGWTEVGREAKFVLLMPPVAPR